MSKLLGSLSGTQLNMFGGLEGAKCVLDGATPYGWTDWTGNNEYSTIHQGTNLVSHGAIGSGDQVYWSNYDPSNQLFYWDYSSTFKSTRTEVLVETQKDIPLECLNQMGDPLDWNTQQQFEIVQYQPNAITGGDVNRELFSTNNGDGTRTYTLLKRSILLVPAELHICISMPPSQTRAGTDSGWQEGNWHGLQLWFKLDFNSWNQQGDTLNQADSSPEQNSPYWKNNPASSTADIDSIDYESGGGFPVAAWISGFLVNIGTSGIDAYDAKVFRQEPANTQTGGSGNPNFDAKVQTYPGLIGRSVPLYDMPGEVGEPPANPTYVSTVTGQDAIKSQAKTYPWAGGNGSPAYFSISVDTIGTYVEGSILSGWKVYYPAVNYRIRVLYAVWGTFTYLWTVQTANDNGYSGWEDRSSTIIVVPGPFDWLFQLFENPIFLIFFFMFIVIIILLLLAIFAPGVLKLGSAIASQGAQKLESKGNTKIWRNPMGVK